MDFSERRFFLLCATVVAGLGVANLMAIFLKFSLGYGTAMGFVPMFEMNNEGNMPTYFSSAMLLFCAVAAAYIGGSKRKGDTDRYRWCILAVAFLFVSVDEFTSIHERLTEPVREMLGSSAGVLYYAWVIPYGLIALAFAAAYLPFVMRLPRRARLIFFAAGFTYVAGAIGVEVLGGAIDASSGRENATYALVAMLEEVLEMLGISAFATALLSYIASEFGGVRVLLGEARSAAPSVAASASPKPSTASSYKVAPP